MTSPTGAVTSNGSRGRLARPRAASFRRTRTLLGTLIAVVVLVGWWYAVDARRKVATTLDRTVDAAPVTEAIRELVVAQRINALVALAAIIGTFWLFNLELSRQERDEARLRDALREADSANEAKSRFLATVSHEIRTPLNAVSGMSDLLLETRLDAEQKEFARAVHNNAEALSTLIGDLLDSSRIEAGQVSLDAAPFDLRELVESVAELLVVRAEAKGVELVVDFPPAAPRRLVGDRARLRQVLMNLVGNAVKFTEQGEVTMRVRAELAPDAGARLGLAVIDTGIGIPRDAQARIFERFVQADLSTARRYGGTGLGLNISRSLIELMGGRLALESEPGHGSTFEADVTLPLATPQPLPDFGPSSLAGVDVVVVQRNASLRAQTGRVLRFAGATVRTAGTAADALTLIAERPPRVIAVGERLPDSSGIDLARRIWHDRYGLPEPLNVVLLCSLRAMAAALVGTYGVAGCVYKPVKQTRLIRAVAEAAGLTPEPTTPPAADAPPAADTPRVRARILVVEDNPDNWTLLRHILGEGGYDVDRVGDGLEAIAATEARAYDLVLMDVELPEIDGLEATRRIRARESAGSGHVPIVALTAHAIESVRADAVAAGMDDYATKPFDKRQILAACAKWIDRRPLLLIADDTPDNCVVLQNYLRVGDYRLLFVANGKEAVAAVERHAVSVVLLDMHMPVMDGYDAARAIRAMPSARTLPILALTSGDGVEERARCLQAGCNDVLSKPVRRADLLARVDHLLGGVPASSVPADEADPDPALPTVRQTGDRLHHQIARRDFTGLAALAASIGARARAGQSSRLAAVSEELVQAARAEDLERAEWWGDQLLDRLRELAPSPVEGDPRVPARRALDALARLATLVLGVPAAAIAAIDASTARMVGTCGVPASLDFSQGVPLSKSVVRFLASGTPLLVEDASVDPQLTDTLAVSAHGAKALAGVALKDAHGVVVGAFCVMDERPRQWPARDVAALEDLAVVAVRLFESAGEAPPPAKASPNRPSDHDLVLDADIVDLVPAYVAARRADLVTLRRCLERADLTGIARLAHKMKGSGAGYGLPAVTRIGGSIEDAARAGTAASIGPLIEELDASLTGLRIRSSDGRVSTEV